MTVKFESCIGEPVTLEVEAIAEGVNFSINPTDPDDITGQFITISHQEFQNLVKYVQAQSVFQ